MAEKLRYFKFLNLHREIWQVETNILNETYEHARWEFMF